MEKVLESLTFRREINRKLQIAQYWTMIGGIELFLKVIVPNTIIDDAVLHDLYGIMREYEIVLGITSSLFVGIIVPSYPTAGDTKDFM